MIASVAAKPIPIETCPAERRSREQVAPELIRPERMLEARPQVGLSEVGVVRIDVEDRRPHSRHLPEAGDREAVEEHEPEKPCGDEGASVAAEPP
jgi:hypothetical protein